MLQDFTAIISPDSIQSVAVHLQQSERIIAAYCLRLYSPGSASSYLTI